MFEQQKAKQSGFSLLEIMLTMAIVVFFLGTAAVSFNPDDPRRDLRSEAFKFKSLMHLVVDEAIFKRQEIGIKFYEDKLEFLIFDAHTQTWVQPQTEGQPSTGSSRFSSLFSNYQFSQSIEVTLEMEDVEIFLNPADEFDSKLDSIDPLANFDEITGEEKEKPDIYIFSSGELTAFDLEFRIEALEDHVYIISANEIGMISCRTEHEEDETCL